MEYTEEQKAIFHEIEHGTGHIVISALAGVGKTSTLVEAVNFIPKDKVIGFTAFNTHVVNELKEKVPEHTSAFTMNSFGFRVCREVMGVKLNKSKLDDILNDLIDKKDPLIYIKSSIKRLVDLAKYNLIDSEDRGSLKRLIVKHDLDFQGNEEDVLDLIPEIFAECKARKKEVDYTDQLWFVYAFNLPVEQYDIFCGDEVQDWNPLQHYLCFRAIEKGGRAVLCGDTFQAIYGFAGADADSIPKLIKKCEETNKGVKILPLTICWRCPKSHIKMAQGIVPAIQASPTAKEGILESIKLNKALEIIDSNDFMICRRNAPLVSVCFQLIRNGKTVMIKGRDIGTNIKTLVKKLKATSIPNLLQKAEVYRNKETIRIKRREDKGEEQKLVTLNDKVDTLIALCEGVRGLQELEKKIEDIFSDDNIKNAIILSSVHKAKGLEANNVFILEYNMIKLPMRQEWAKVQENNLHYISLTRSKDKLYLLSY